MLAVFLKSNKDVLKVFKTHLEAKEEEAGPKTTKAAPYKKAPAKESSSESESEEEVKPKKVVG